MASAVLEMREREGREGSLGDRQRGNASGSRTLLAPRRRRRASPQTATRAQGARAATAVLAAFASLRHGLRGFSLGDPAPSRDPSTPYK